MNYDPHMKRIRSLRGRRFPLEPDPVEPGITAIRDALESVICRRRNEEAADLIYRALARVQNAEQLDRSMVKIASELPHCVAHRLM